MRTIILLSYIFIILIFAFDVSAQKQKADLIIVNAKVHTMDKKNDKAEAIAIKDNKIIAVGKYNKISKLIGTRTKRVDARERAVIPGFNDSHTHFMGIGNLFSSVDLKNVRTPQEMVEKLRYYVKFLPKGRWILGGQWNNDNWTPNDLPTKELIDAVTPENPVFLYSSKGQMALANSLALKIAGVDKNKNDIANGKIFRDEKGEPTGILQDNATLFVKVRTPQLSTKQLLEVAETATNYAASLGVTSVQNMQSDNIFELMKELEKQGKLKNRIYDCSPIFDWKKLADAGIQRADGDALIRRGCLKFFADGYSGENGNLYEMISGADKANLQVMIHAIGSQANTNILDIFEKVFQENGTKDRRYRVEHAYGLRDEDIERFGKLNVIASLQPHLFGGGQPYQALLRSNARIAFGSDASITDFDPMLGIYKAVSRGNNYNGRSQELSVEEAVYLYTMGSAYAEFQDDIKGSITVGKLADIVILSDDIFDIDTEDIPKTKVVMTIMNGEIVYNERNFAPEKSPNVR